MTISKELSQHWRDRTIALILDNEVTAGHFVTDPALPWIRMVYAKDGYRIAEGYPDTLDADLAKREMTNWDQVDLNGIHQALQQRNDAVNCFVIGNNAGQGLPLAAALDETRRATDAVVIFGTGLPEEDRYRALGYRQFCARADLVPLLSKRARAAGRGLSLAFINTIQHNESNYHDP